MFPSRLRTRVFSVLFSFLKWILSGSWSRHGVIFSKTLTYPACSSQVDLHWASPHLPWGMQRICGAFFFRIYLCLSRDFVNQHVFLLLDLHWDSPKLPWGMQRIFVPFVLKTVIMPFKRFFVLWHSLIRSLYFIHFYIFIPLTHSAPFFRFSYILLYTNVFLCILPREIFFLFLMTLLLGILLLFFFNFSSQRPHLNCIFLSNVYSFDTMEFAMKHSTNSPILTNKASMRVVIVWYKWKPRMCQSCCFEVGCYPFL